MTNRRNFLKQGVLTSVGISTVALGLAADNDQREPKKKGKINLKDQAILLLQGDSITQSGRHVSNKLVNNSAALGNGYAFITAGRLLQQMAGRNLQIYNRGVSGDKIIQLQARWEDDCILLKPDVLTVLVGINDFNQQRSGKYQGTPESYESNYRQLLTETKNKLPDVQLVIGEPFLLRNQAKPIAEKWWGLLDEYQQAAKRVASSFNAVFVPNQQLFDQACKDAPPEYWSADGVHPTIAGSQLLSDAIMKCFY